MVTDFSAELDIFKSVGVTIINIIPEKESAEYSACQFTTADNRKMLFRKSKITPTKNGQFVTLWKRMGAGPIAPFSDQDNITSVIISVENEANSGYFIFPASVLCSRKIFTANGMEGKRAFRVYPPWDIPESKQATTTQKWQLFYFVEIMNTVFSNVDVAIELFSRQ
jgi:hypothetical protein